jgi:hypothetical protein
MRKIIEKFGGRKTFSWNIVTIIAAVALFTDKLSGGEWITFTIASFALLGVANVTQKVFTKSSQPMGSEK